MINIIKNSNTNLKKNLNYYNFINLIINITASYLEFQLRFKNYFKIIYIYSNMK